MSIDDKAVEFQDIENEFKVDNKVTSDEEAPVATMLPSNSSKGLAVQEEMQFNMRQVKFGPIVFNPTVTIIGAVILWGLAIYCMVSDDAAATLADIQGWVTQTFSWLYIGSQDIWIVFLIYVYIYYGDRKLGDDGEEPEFDNVSYFAMIFCAGIGADLLYFGVAEPLFHYQGYGRYNKNPATTQNENSQHSINLTLFHWGLHGWCVYSFVACLLGFMCYRKKLPLTVRSCFYPLLGDHTWGWMGDVVDGVSIITIVAGVCTSLGIGASQILDGMVVTGIIDQEVLSDESKKQVAQVVCIWGITLLATASVISGLDRGIKFLSQFAFALGLVLIISVLFLDHTFYLLNLMVQSTGFYFQWIIQLGFFTDAFAQLKPLEGASVNLDESADRDWFGWWTMFYWGWWIAWAPFVGTFLARISRGRTIRQVFNYTMTIPMAFMIVWFGTFGGAGIRMYRRAEELQELGVEMYGNASYFAVGNPDDGCYAVPKDLDLGLEGGFEWDQSVSPVCTFIGERSWFLTMQQYSGIGQTLCVISLFTMVAYFITSSDSGSLVVDSLASNGREEHHVSQRVFWAFTEGAVATALLVFAGDDGLTSLQNASLIVGLPYTFFLCMMTTCFWRALKYDKEGESDNSWNVFGKNQFSQPVYGGVFDIFEVVFGLGPIKTGRGASFPTPQVWVDFVLGLGLPFIGLFAVLKSENGNIEAPNLRFANMGKIFGSIVLFNITVTLGATIFFVAAFFMVILGASGVIDSNFIYFGAVSYTIFATIVTYVRFMVRNKYEILGNIAEDFFASWLLYPQVIAQLVVQLRIGSTTVVD